VDFYTTLEVPFLTH